MTIHPFPGSGFIRPDPDPEADKGLAAQPDAAPAAEELADHDFQSRNVELYEHDEIVEREDTEIPRLEREERRYRLKRDRQAAERTVVKREIEDQIPGIHICKSFLLMGLAAGGLYMGSEVGTKYAQASGLDMFVSDEHAARVFFGVAVLASGMLKAWECFLESDFARKCFRLTICVIGVPVLVFWLLSTALVLAPDTSGGARALLGDNEEMRLLTSVLVFTHLLADVLFSYLCFTAAEDVLLAGNKRVTRPTDKWVFWDEKARKVGIDVIESRSLRGKSLSWLKARGHAAAAYVRRARATVMRKKTVVDESVKAAEAQARAEASK